ncbi:type II 3-dehydroquinate dehydratase [Rickettsiales endosymbiont of Stachyamoeba lipophora]|uniref:type II 3-dehydroquinate dehydratase n=1 Tax=Rickettsiales endosymbiont of Stachyamoeba lipophora TaxID=2486578 RepID=UPI000F64E8AE|nr:type II 3-dehydroquinate dehydratase [Rickettsiales endosymbiont of Stachyamoeba lipophora]AZL15209.1 type II 3-dehydroquinate dehydratase [Rickettsiales endosymbiont of Stachyamoeba lipophora]
MTNILIINGPNLNLLGFREPEIYGYDSLDDIFKQCQDFATEAAITIDFKQSNHEGEIIDWIQNSQKFDGIVINAAAYSHTSIAIADTLKAINKPFIEIHLSNIYKREEFRHKSYLSNIANGVISGFGSYSYILGLKALKQILD